MNKLDMAHEYLRDIISNWKYDESFNPVAEAWKYADLMQAEAYKREQEENKKKNDRVMQIISERKARENKLLNIEDSPQSDWQPDWTQAPKADAWRMYGDGSCAWLIDIGNNEFNWYQSAPSFSYQGDWKKSLRKRPQ